MIDWVQLLSIASAIGCGLIGGVFFTFSNFVMPALVRLPPVNGMAAMQAINVTVLNPGFLVAFVGTALLSAAGVVVGFIGSGPADWALIAGGLLYVVGTFAVTAGANVPLNNALASLEPDGAGAPAAWTEYARRWTLWNHVRTAAALLGGAAFAIA